MPRILTAGLLVFVVALVAFELSVNGVWATDHPTSFVQLDYALWHDHSFALTSATRVPPWSVDDFVYRGQNYSALAPGTAFLALPFTGLGFTLAGGYTAYGDVLLLSEAFVALTGALAAYVLYRLASLYFRRSTSVFLGFAFAFSTILWPFATYFFQSDPSALFVLLTAYFGVKAARAEGGGAGLALLSGLSGGVAFTLDSVNGVLLPILMAFILLGRRRGGGIRSAGAYLLGSLPGFAAIGYYNYSIFGNPLVGTEQSYLHVSSVLGSFTTSPIFGLTLDTVSLARGLLIFAPVLLLGLIGYLDALRDGSVRLEMFLYLAIFLGILVPYSMWYEPDGGLSYGPRFIVAAIPFLLLPAGYVVDQARGWRRGLIYGVYLAGVVMNGMAAVVSAIPAIPQGANEFAFSPFASVVLPAFLRGGLDTTWGFGSPHAAILGALLIFAFGVVIPVATVELVRRRENMGGLGPGRS
ncbi:MAG: hypothetical protein JRN06_03490 [Nitrososphaerota archaeon]|nr:hypothetical protein [Nitrososphaerota archaeon]MDG7023078.1 hypothetical protein [Nitrososphaerota archaeon]